MTLTNLLIPLTPKISFLSRKQPISPLRQLGSIPKLQLQVRAGSSSAHNKEGIAINGIDFQDLVEKNKDGIASNGIDFQDLVEKCLPCISHIVCFEWSEGHLRQVLQGVGFIVDNTLVTSAHLICKLVHSVHSGQYRWQYRFYKVFLMGFKKPLTPLAIDTATNLAVMALPEGVCVDRLVDMKFSESVRIGDPVFIIGHGNSGSYSFRLGNIQFLNRRYTNSLYHIPRPQNLPTDFTLLETNLVTGFGFSGGPVFNMMGEVIGVHVATFQFLGFESLEVPAKFVKDLLARVEGKGSKKIFVHDEDEAEELWC